MKAKKARMNSAVAVKAQENQDTVETDINAEHAVWNIQKKTKQTEV